jgi:hypothetical protein
VAGIADGADVAGLIPIQSGDNVVHVSLALTGMGTALLSFRRASARLEPSA